MSVAANAITLTVYLVGLDAEDAATSLPFSDYSSARHHAHDERSDAGDPLLVFAADAVLDLSALALVEDPWARSADEPPVPTEKSLGEGAVVARIRRRWEPDAALTEILALTRLGEHHDPTVLATWDSAPQPHQPCVPQRPAPTRPDGTRFDVAELATDLADAAAAAGVRLREPTPKAGAGPRARGPVWHCSLRHHDDEQPLTDAQWTAAVQQLLHRVGIAPRDDLGACRWVAVRQNDHHVHLIAVLVRQDAGRPVHPHNDLYWAREALRTVRPGSSSAPTSPPSSDTSPTTGS